MSYRASLNLPKFAIPVKRPSPSLNAERWRRLWSEAYEWQLAHRVGASVYSLHDGPPYANGRPHVGHALNKVLKDAASRYQCLRGRRVKFRLGWDCHGLPIELKAAPSPTNETAAGPSANQIRRRARAFADRCIAEQKAAFQQWGVLSAASEHYETKSPAYQSRQLLAFDRLHRLGLVHRSFLPVHWSDSSGTALAEAELEYRDDHQSDSAYVLLPLARLAPGSDRQDGGHPLAGGGHHLLVWTTTPWTLPANAAVAVGPGLRYALRRLPDGRTVVAGAHYSLGGGGAGREEEEAEALAEFPAEALIGCSYRHPFSSDTECPVVPSDHVTADKGTGLVHVAPAHGREDFLLGTKFRLPLVSMVTESGRYGPAVPEPSLAGLHCLTEGSAAVLDSLRRRGLLARTERLEHSYPYDWRTGRPVMLRASSQWFLDTDRLRDRALAALAGVRVLPERQVGSLRHFVLGRPYWCISRQRVHGVPIPVLYAAGEPLYDSELTHRFAEHAACHGTDAWFELSAEQLAARFGGQRLRERAAAAAGRPPLEKGGDIFDIWMDSGLTWLDREADLDEAGQASACVEGQDQFRGWFSSSLLLSVALRDRAPYKTLVVHGFTVDERGRKMSKSLGNVVDPDQVIRLYGPDGLRYWAASAGLSARPEIGDSLLAAADGHARRLRSHLRFLLACVADLPPDPAAPPAAGLTQNPLDAGYLSLLRQFVDATEAAYDSYSIGDVCRLAEQLLSQAAGPYCAAAKHRLYCLPADSPQRRSAQAALWESLRAVVMATAPILPHLAEEVYAAALAFRPDGFGRRPPDAPASVFLEAWDFPGLAACSDPAPGRQLRALVRLRSAALGSDESADAALVTLRPVGSGWDFLRPGGAGCWHRPAEDPRFGHLAELFRCAAVRVDFEGAGVGAGAAPEQLIADPDFGEVGIAVARSADAACPRCRRRTAGAAGELCAQCAEAVTAGWEARGDAAGG